MAEGTLADLHKLTPESGPRAVSNGAGGDGLAFIEEALQAAGCEPRDGRARCPAHDDDSPSLSYSTTDEGKVLLYCHAGCLVDNILLALGLEWKDIFPPDVRYQYGEFTKVRKSLPGGRKTFVWRPTLKGADPGLYRQSELTEAIAAGQTVVVCEGEKDVETLWANGVPATTSPHGSHDRAWRPAYTALFAGADVIVIADDDTPGLAHGRRVASELETVANSVSLKKAAVGKDATDHFQAGRSLDDLVPIELGAVEAPDGNLSVQRVDGKKIEFVRASTLKMQATDWLWETKDGHGRIPQGSLSVIAGDGGLGKSTTAIQLAAWLTTGEMYGPYYGKPQSVVISTTEDRFEQTCLPRLKAAGADLERVFKLSASTDSLSSVGLTLPDDLGELEELAKAAGPVFMILDPLTSRLGSLDTYKDAEVRQGLEPLVALAASTNMTILGIMHVVKGSVTRSAIGRIQGSAAFGNVPRSVFYVVKDATDPEVRVLGQVKNNLGREDLPQYRYRIEELVVGKDDRDKDIKTTRIVWDGESPVTVEEIVSGKVTKKHGAGAWLLAYLNSKPDGTALIKEIERDGKEAGHARATLNRARADLPQVMTWNTHYWRLFELGPGQAAHAAMMSAQ